MGRKSVEEIAKSKKPYGRDDIWKAIRKLGKRDARFTTREVYDECKHEINIETIKDYMASLVAAKILGLCAPTKKFNASVYCLYKGHGAETPRVRRDGSLITKGLGTEAMWRTIKNLSPFTIGDLVLVAGTEKAPIRETTAQTYVQYLVKAGYVRENKKQKPRSYSFVNSQNPGPLAPQIQRTHQVFDPNTQTVVWPKGGVE